MPIYLNVMSILNVKSYLNDLSREPQLPWLHGFRGDGSVAGLSSAIQKYSYGQVNIPRQLPISPPHWAIHCYSKSPNFSTFWKPFSFPCITGQDVSGFCSFFPYPHLNTFLVSNFSASQDGLPCAMLQIVHSCKQARASSMWGEQALIEWAEWSCLGELRLVSSGLNLSPLQYCLGCCCHLFLWIWSEQVPVPYKGRMTCWLCSASALLGPNSLPKRGVGGPETMCWRKSCRP